MISEKTTALNPSASAWSKPSFCSSLSRCFARVGAVGISCCFSAHGDGPISRLGRQGVFGCCPQVPSCRQHHPHCRRQNASASRKCCSRRRPTSSWTVTSSLLTPNASVCGDRFAKFQEAEGGLAVSPRKPRSRTARSGQEPHTPGGCVAGLDV